MLRNSRSMWKRVTG